MAWTQKFSGEIQDTIRSRHLAIKPDFSNEVYSNKNGADFDVSLFVFWERRPDSLYHYANGRFEILVSLWILLRKKFLFMITRNCHVIFWEVHL